jgi:amino acid adenylation domain-containing protein/FkbH-like protein/FkbM family methyltransferase
VDRVGRHDNFFELGGHSLIGTQVVSRVRQSTGYEMPLRCLFERPTVAGLAEWLDSVAGHENQGRRDPELVPVAADERPVVSFAQERLWLLEQLILGAPIYNIPAVIRLDGELTLPALEHAATEITRRHEVLRTNFRVVDGQPVPVSRPGSPCAVTVADLRGLSPDARTAALRSLTKAEALRPFDLARDPLVRLSVARLGASKHLLFVTMHHIVSDGWSIGILMQELAVLYEAFASGRPSRLAEPVIQYRDYASWQRRSLRGSALDEQLAHWTTALSGARTTIDLPLDRTRPSSPSYRGSTETRLLQPELVDALEAFGKERGLTPFMVMLTALNILLARMTRQNDLVVGTVTSGRTRTEIEPLIGCFMNFLPLRANLSDEASGETLLQQVRTTVLDATAHQECPFQRIVEAVQPDRSNSQNPLFNVAFQFENYPQSDSFTDTLTASFETPHWEIALLDLRFVGSETPAGTVVSCEYATDLFDGRTIGALLDALCSLLEKLVREPKTRLQDFPVPESVVVRAQPETVAIAATFTAEPVEESIALWTDTLDPPCRVQFAPYGQVFQQLLTPDSVLSTNRRGLNVVLLRLEDWQRSSNRLLLQVAPDEKERILAGQARVTLPNRLEIAHLNPYETEYLYEEIFVDQVYLKHGIELHDGDCVFDVGANIGMFTMFVKHRVPNATIHAFEPAPHTFEVLRANVGLYGPDVHLHHCGVADDNTEATFTFYPRSSVFSSFHADADEDTHAIRAVVLNSLEKAGGSNGSSAEAFADEFLSRRLDSQKVVTQLRTISSVVRENGIDRIDLLKVDAEKSELPVLRGIDDDVWRIIRQIVIEVHDQEGPVLAEVLGMLRQHGFEATVEEEDALRGSGLYNIYGVRAPVAASERRGDANSAGDGLELQRKVEELGRALTTAAERTVTPWLVIICPSSPAVLSDPARRALHEQMEGLLASSLKDATGVTLVRPADLARAYPLPDYYDRHGDELGHVPYTREFFAAMGTSIVRHFAGMKSAPKKVIVLDCDHTLWKGVCAEDGVAGISIDPARKALQEFMVAQHDAGRLICLCSKNQEADVFEVFDRRDDMVLRREHLVSSRINWRPKSENIRSLAEELQLGLDSFVFLDDNPVECAEVRANCPEVLSLQLPQAAEKIPAFLASVWAFDQARITAEDKQRTRLYQQNAQREQLRERSLTFAEFLADLELDVSIDRMSPHHLRRVSQLTQRTNQFNVNKVERSEHELDAMFREANAECLTVHVSDRFGDYGLVGVAICESTTERLDVDTFLLSCRALGKGVEHRMLARLGEIAAERGLAHVRIPLKRTNRNQPALEFLTSVGARYGESNGDGVDFVIPTHEAQSVTFQPDSSAAAVPDEEPTGRAAPAAKGGWSVAGLSELSARLLDVAAIVAAIDDRKLRRVRSDRSARFVAPRTQTQRLIAGIVEQVLGVDRVGLYDDFFDLGGHSLLATQLISRLCDVFSINLPLQTAFDAPTVDKLSRIVESAKKAHAVAAIPPVRPAERRADKPLSFAQERLWFLDQFEPGSSLFNNPVAVRLRGSLNTAAFNQALATVVARHETLRTTFRRDGDRAVQVVEPVGRPDLLLIDLRGCREEVLRQLALAESQRPFDLERGPLVRVSLLRLSSDEHVVLLNMHHIVSDGWSAGVVMNELSALYEAYTAGNCSSLTDLPVQYGDFAIWQREWLDGAVLDAQLSYWRERLHGAPLTLDLPTDSARPSVRTYQGALASRAISRTLSDQLSRLSRQERVTSFMTFLAAFQVLLTKYVGRGDVVVGTTIANRLRPELEGLIGLFVNTLALRLDLTDNPSFRETLSRVREVTLGAYAHQDLPFEKLVEALQPVRDMSRTPVVQVSIEAREESVATLSLRGLSVTREAITAITAKNDLSLLVVEQDGTPVRFDIEYNVDLFQSSSMDRLLEQFEVLLQAVVDDPGRHVADLPVLSETERRQLLVEWNATSAEWPDECLHELIEAQVRTCPDAVAVVDDDQQLTYGELNRKANQLARYLRSLGLGSESRVGLCLNRSIELVIGVLGVLKAGAAYVPMDPAYPSSRLAFILEDSVASVVLSNERLAASLPAHNARVVFLDSTLQSVTAESGENLGRQGDSRNLSHVIYTSGSTGRPKGVAIEQRSVVTLVRWSLENYSREELAGVLAATSICFDLSVWELFVPLSTGGTVILAPTALDLPALHGAQRVTLVNTVPSAIAELLRAGGIPSSVRTVNLAGEPLTTELSDALYATATIEKVCDLYGPSEDTTYSTFARRAVGDRPTIGRPLANTRVYLGELGRSPVPIGVAGEVQLSGAGLARGYLDRPDLTAERFLPDALGPTPGQRLYRTGDLARWRADGRLDFLGRIDHQVKIRGFRIELGEIEAALRELTTVREAIVLAREDQPGVKRLVAYLSANGQAPTVTDLRDHLQDRLPGYMIPTAFVILDSLPLLPNGKVDRRALPAPDQTRPELEGAFVAARNSVERQVAEIWCQVLGLEQVGVHDNFFELGGHSLLATKIVSRIRAVFGTELPLRRVFESPTVSELARSLGEVEARSSGAPGADMGPLERTVHDGPLPLSFAQQRLWFLDQMEPGNPYYNMPAALRLSGHVQMAALESAFSEIRRRHEVLQTGYVLQHGQPMQVLMPHNDVPVRFVDLSSLDEALRDEEVQRLAALDARRPFDLSRGEVLRVTLLKCSETSHTMLFAMHHIASDGWSLAIVIRELSVLYAAFGGGRPSSLTELPVQYADFGVWQRKWLESDGLKLQLAYWKARLGGQLPTLDIRTDRPRPEIETFRGADEILLIPRTLSTELNRLSAREHVTLFMTLVAAYKTLLYRNIGEDDVIVGTDLAGRNRAELEGLVGFFVNLLVLRSDLSGNPTFRDLLVRVRETAMGALAHQDVPFDRLVEELRPKRHRSRTPLFQMLFVMENIPQETLRLPGLTMTPVANQADTARFDMALFVREQEDGIVTKWTYKTDLFDRSTIQRFANQYLALLEGIAAAPDTRLNELELRTQAEISEQALEEQRRLEARKSSLVPGRRRARNLSDKPGSADVHRADAEDDATAGDTSKQVRTQ